MERSKPYTYRVISQSLEEMQSSPYCFATMVGGRQTLAPLRAEMSQMRPDSQSESCRHSSPYFRPYITMHVPLTEKMERKTETSANK
uniref:Uncharacterized protein n=1 Tax=Anopheles albimanus TaxID=7167 RepID=A0A182FX09_ANOAL